MKKYITFVILFLLLGIVAVFLFHARSIFQEGNPLPVTFGVVKLAMTGTSYTKLDEHKYLVKAEEKDRKQLFAYLAQHDLTYSTQEGAAYFFKTNNGKMYMAITRMLSTNFEVFDFSNI